MDDIEKRMDVRNKVIISSFIEFRDTLDACVLGILQDEHPEHLPGLKFETLEAGEQLAIRHPESALQIRADLIERFAGGIRDGIDEETDRAIQSGWDWTDD